MNLLLLLLFIIHLGVALRLFIKRRRLKYGMFVGVFLSLIASVLVRMFLPDLMVLNVPVTTMFRYTAVILTLISACLIVLNMFRAGR